MSKSAPNFEPATKQRKYFSKSQDAIDLPNLIEVQTKSYDWFIKEGIAEVFDEIGKVEDYSKKNLEVTFKDYYLEDAKQSEKTSKLKKLTYEAPLRVSVELKNKDTGKSKTQEIFFGDMPLMTKRGTFIINGSERVIVSQLTKSAGVLFDAEETGGKKYFKAKIVPEWGPWVEIETSSQGVLYVKIDRKRKFPVTTMLRAFGVGGDEEILKAFASVNTDKEHDYIKATLDKEISETRDEAYVEIYKKFRPGDLATAENSRSLIDSIFFDPKKYNISRVGRYKLNRRLGVNLPYTKENRIFRVEELIDIVKEIIRLNNEQGSPDEVDSLDTRRLRTVGELLQRKFRVGMQRVERYIKDKMSTCEPETVTPSQLINVRPIVAHMKEFFASSQLSQFMEQINPVAEIKHKRTLSALGPGGLVKERAGFEVRDVHRTHYGRICPIETPEGPNIGLVNTLASYATTNEYGFLVTPYRKVVREVKNDGKSAVGEISSEIVKDAKGKKVVGAGVEITVKIAKDIAKINKEKIKVQPRVTKEIVHLDISEEEKMVIAQAGSALDEKGYFKEKKLVVRRKLEADEASPEEVDFVDVSSKQPVGISAALIPFLEHDDAKRALMGANMQRQAVSLVNPEEPLVGTGIEEKVADASGQVVRASSPGKVVSSTADSVTVKYDSGKEETYILEKFAMSNTGTCINQRTVAQKGQKLKKGDLIIDGTAIKNGEIALGQNVLVAYMNWHGRNYEDAIIVSERLVQGDRYTSIHLDEKIAEIRDTKLGPEVITRDIPNVGEEALRDLDEDGIIRVGAEVSPGDILVGKITAKGETELTAEERLLRAIFGEKARDVKDSSMKLPSGKHGKVIDVRTKSRDKGDSLPVGVIKQVFVTIAQMRKIAVGDKMSGRHGNKGVVAEIVPVEDLPHLEDGTPVDIILNPLGVISRMNIGQILETHLGLAAKTLGYKVASPIFDGVKIKTIKEELKKSGFPEDGKVQLYDGKTGRPFNDRVTIGYNYMLKLLHLVDDKVHARSIGPYSMVTQQPLGGKAQMGGQRLGEMEVWALEAYGSAYTLQEMLTVKSDDVIGRRNVYESTIKGEEIREPGVPESFNVLVKELQGLGLNVEFMQKKGDGRVKRTVDAEEVVQENYDEYIEELKDEKIIEGEEMNEMPEVDLKASDKAEEEL